MKTLKQNSVNLIQKQIIYSIKKQHRKQLKCQVKPSEAEDKEIG